MEFHDKEGVIPHDALTNDFLQDQAVTLFLYTHKNSVQNKSNTMEAISLKHRNLVLAAAW